MLTLKNIKKSYIVGEIVTDALRGVSTSFREKEFVAILGKSGSGKTTALNIIGGLDRYDSGDLIIKGRHTKDFLDKDWDAYRNNSIGFVFQSYNLINHLTIVDNVEIGMTLSGVDAKEKRRRTLEVLTRVGLKDHLHKKPNQLSGGQQQRVAIARALANDPEILLCDEPTGALDTETSRQIMDLIKEIASDRLVIMVTHNPELAHTYANRILEFEDGLIVSDSNPYDVKDVRQDFNLKHTKMKFMTALKISFNNIKTKLGRTTLTSLASSIGIIGIAIILSLSTGFKAKIDEYQTEALAEFPIIISNQTVVFDEGNFGNTEGIYPNTDFVIPYNPLEEMGVHQNKLTDEFLDYIENIDKAYANAIGYTYTFNMNLLRQTTDGYHEVKFTGGPSAGFGASGLNSIPVPLDGTSNPILSKNYDILAGSLPKEDTDIVILVDSKNRVDQQLLLNLGFKFTDKLSFNDIVDTKIKWIPNNAYYQKHSTISYSPNLDKEAVFNSEHNIELNISGIIRLKESSSISLFSQGVIYSDAIVRTMIENSLTSDIVIDQLNTDVNVLTGSPFVNSAAKETMLMTIGGSKKPTALTVFPLDFTTKENIITYIDAYNDTKTDKADKIVYTDLAETISSLTGSIMDGITIVLVAFASISLVVSLIMIGIITYTSVLERTKEIGILKALGARKKDITRVFDAETFILGVFSGVLGIAIAYLLTIPINIILYNLTDLNGVASLKIIHAIILVALSTGLTVLGGHIPAKMAAKKDAVTALRSE